MNRLILVLLFFMAFEMQALGARKCAALSPDAVSCSATATNAYSMDWSATCSAAGRTTQIKGIAMCSQDFGSSDNIAVSDLTWNTYDTSQNIYCWCKIVIPAVSSTWVFASKGLNARECTQNCAGECARYFSGDREVRSYLLYNLINA